MPKSQRNWEISGRLTTVMTAWFGSNHGCRSRFARAIEVSPGNVGDWFSDKRDVVPRAQVLERIGKVLQVDPAWILTGRIDRALCVQLQAARRMKGDSHEDVAKKTAVPAMFVKLVESFRLQPSRAYVERFASAYEVWGTFFDDEGTDEDAAGRVPRADALAILSLLGSDLEAVPLVLDLLRSRRAAREAERNLRQNPDA